MKKTKNSFLFFLIYFISFFYINSKTIYAQNSIDSLSYFYRLGTNPKKNTDLTLAYNFYKKQKEQNLRLKDTLAAVQNLRLIASFQKSLGSLYDSEASAIEALELLDNLKFTKTTNGAKLGLYNHLGIIYKDFYNQDKALEFYEKALKIAQTTKDSITIINNKANVFLAQKKFEKAIKEFSNIYTLQLKYQNKIKIARALDNLGVAQSKLNLPKALPNMLEALNIRIAESNTKDIYTSYSHLTQYYHTINNKEKAKHYANKAYSLAKTINSASYIEDALSNIISLNDDSKILEYKKIKDSIAKSKLLSRNIYSYNKYQYDKKERELIKTKFEREKEQFVYKTIGLFLLLLSIFLYVFVRIKHKKEKLKEVYNTETRISQKVHDELANDVYNVMNRIQNNSSLQQNEVLNQLEDIYKKTRDISYQNGTINLENQYYSLELKDMIYAYQNESIRITTIGLSQDIFENVANHKKISTERVLKELMTNMKKHSKASNVVISFKKDKRNVNIKYTDDGVGFNKSTPNKHNGLQNAENRIKNINGSLNFGLDTEKGVVINISFPV